MAEDNQDAPKPTHLGVFSRRAEGGSLDPADTIGIALTAVWLLGTGLFFLIAGAGGGGDPLRFVMIVMAILLPVAMIWIGAMTAKNARLMRAEAERMEAAVDAMRKSHVAQAQSAGTTLQPSVEKKLDEIARAQRKTETALAMFTSIRHGDAPQPTPDPGRAATTVSPEAAQPSLALDTGSVPAAPASTDDFIAALNFPETAEDAEGFRALHRAMADPRAAKLIQASQDVLTLLSQDGIYMDDMRPDRSRPELWRRFAQGERGRQIAALGGIRDRTSITLAAARMRRDHIFRDTAHHFLRTFDHSFAEFEKTATDAEIAALTETRSARAFMLLGRVAGVFD